MVQIRFALCHMDLQPSAPNKTETTWCKRFQLVDFGGEPDLHQPSMCRWCRFKTEHGRRLFAGAKPAQDSMLALVLCWSHERLLHLA
jgi:hypothetical protein